MLREHFKEKNLHHAYLIEGDREKVLTELLEVVESLGYKTRGNPDFYHISTDIFKIDDSRNLKLLGSSKSFSGDRKIFIICANNFLLEAQNSLLKLFEEPGLGSHYFLITPSTSIFLPTLLSRFYIIARADDASDRGQAEQFLKMRLEKRLDFIKELLAEEDSEDGSTETARSKSQSLLNALEQALYLKLVHAKPIETHIFEQIFIAREFLRVPGSSTKTLMESVALTVPVLQ